MAQSRWDLYSGWATPPNGGAQYRLKMTVYVAGQNVAANQSLLAVEVSLEKDRSFNGFYAYSASYEAQIGGAYVWNDSGVWPNGPWTGWSIWPVGSGYITVTHNTDGTKTVQAHAGYTGANSGWSIGALGLTEDIVLPPIPRATIPTVTPNPATVGSTVTIDLPRVVGTYTHDVTWTSGTLSGTIGTGLGASTTWTVPSVMGEFPGKPKGSIAITVVTKSGVTVIGSRQITLFAQTAPTLVVGPNLNVVPIDVSKQFDVRARLVTYESGTWAAKGVVPVSGLSMVDSASATATCSLEISTLLATDFADDSIVDIDIYNGTDWVYTNHRFVLSRKEGDEIDPTEMATYSGTEFIDHVLASAYTQVEYVWGEEGFAGATSPGEMMRFAIADAKNRGWGPRVEIEFTAAKTSLGETWANTDLKRRINKGTPLSQMLQGLVDDGLVEYRTEYRSNKAYLVLMNPGTGSNYANEGAVPVVNFNLAKLSRAPRRKDSGKRLTSITVSGDEEVQITRSQSPYDADVFGTMEGWVSASGVTSDDEARRIGDNALRDNSSATNERTFEYSSSAIAPVFYPYYVFIPGDWVIIPDGDNPITDRINQITIAKDTDATLLTVLTGDRILSGTASLAKRQQAQTGGSIAGGTQNSPAPLDSRIPAQVVVNTVTSEGYWTIEGQPRSEVTISWAAVTLAMNGASIPVDFYEVYWRTIGTEWAFRGATDDLSLIIPGWEVDQDIELRVRARSAAGIYGPFSENEEHTTATPAVDLDGPDLADLYTDGVGNIYAVWGGTLDGAPAPARVAYVALEVSDDAGATYVTMGTPIVAAGSIIANPGAWGDFMVRLRAYDRLGNPGDASDPESITLTDPHIHPSTPLPPDNLIVTPGVGWDASGFQPEAWFDLEWDAVTDDVSGNPINVIGYDVWGRSATETEYHFLTSSTTTQVRWLVTQGETWSFQVRAASEFGGISIFSDTITDTADATVSAPIAPAAPTLEQYLGLLKINWSGVGMVPQIRFAYASISTTVGGTYTRAGNVFVGAGQAVVANLAPGNYYAKMTVVDELGQTSTSPASAVIDLLPPTGTTYQTSPLANTGIKITSASLTAYGAAGTPTFTVDAATGEVWIAAYSAVFDLGASGFTAEGTPVAVTGIAISDPSASSFNTFIHPSGLQIRNDQVALSWWEGDPTDAGSVNFFSQRAYIKQRLRVGDYEDVVESKTAGATRLVTRYKGL